MEMTNKRINAKKRLRIMILGSVALLIAALSAPLFLAHAGGCSKSKGATTSSSTTGSTTSSSVSDFSSATLVCVSRSTAVSTLASGAGGSDESSSKKATICHIPPGNPDNPQTLSVSKSAVPAHMDHGDSMGTCADAATLAYVEALPSCTTLEAGSSVTGVWLPDGAAGNGTTMNAYVAQLQAGGISAQPDSGSRSYREISGQ